MSKQSDQKRSERRRATRNARKNPLIGTLDFETDPFKDGRVPQAFACAIFDGEEYRYWWGDDCWIHLGEYLGNIHEPRIIYAHNGGKFDFHYIYRFIQECAEQFDAPELLKTVRPFVINGRIVKMHIGNVELRDSYAILPVGLAQYSKMEIDYSHMEREVREQYRDEILEYLRYDVMILHELVLEFRKEFGDALTIGSAALKELTDRCPWDKLAPAQDQFYRPFYFGGRVNCFEKGIIHADLKIYDINSQYPSVMSDFCHPVGNTFKAGKVLTDDTDFAVIVATSKGVGKAGFGCLPVRVDEGLGISFPAGKPITYYATGHEIRTALELGLLNIHEVKGAYTCDVRTTFEPFVSHFYAKRMMARKVDDKARTLFYKLILNSAYGKFAQNPEDWRDVWMVFSPYWPYEDHYDKYPHPCNFDKGFNHLTDWRMDSQSTIALAPYRDGDIESLMCRVFSRANDVLVYNNVATAASITGAARARLMRGLAKCTRPVYCDTDSIVCSSLSDDIDPVRLGAFKFEGDVDKAMIHSPKMYLLYKDGELVKMATKGIHNTPEEIAGLFEGRDVQYNNIAPAFKLGRAPVFVKRKVRALHV
jgi:hypothetical protein